MLDWQVVSVWAFIGPGNLFIYRMAGTLTVEHGLGSRLGKEHQGTGLKPTLVLREETALDSLKFWPPVSTGASHRHSSPLSKFVLTSQFENVACGRSWQGL